MQYDLEDSASISDEPILSEQEHRDLMSLLNKNISMDFILEMKEAFQLFDKVGKMKQCCFTYKVRYIFHSIFEFFPFKLIAVVRTAKSLIFRIIAITSSKSIRTLIQ